MSTPKQKWKKFERLVAAIHVAEATGASVTWNEHINGRQFDVAIRFKFQYYEYLVLIECRDHERSIEAEDVEAFVTKSHDAGANKAIFVSSSGFQSGAKNVAKTHNIELFTLTEIYEMPEEKLADIIISILVLWPIGFWKTGTREVLALSRNPQELTNQIQNTRMIGFGDLKLIDILKPYSQLLAPFDIPGVPKFGGSFPVATKKRQNQAVTLQLRTKVVLPGSEEEIPVSHLLVSYWMQDARLIRGPDPVVSKKMSLKYQYKNELTEQATTIQADKLPIGFDTKFEAGRFYHQPSLDFSYYCESIEETEATMYLVESYQHGQLVQASSPVELAEAKYYVEVTDPKEIARLKPMYESGKRIEEDILRKLSTGSTRDRLFVFGKLRRATVRLYEGLRYFRR